MILSSGTDRTGPAVRQSLLPGKIRGFNETTEVFFFCVVVIDPNIQSFGDSLLDARMMLHVHSSTVSVLGWACAMPEFLKWLAGAVGAILMFATSVSPEEAGSKLAAWAKFLGWENPSHWLLLSSVDTWVFWAGFILFSVWFVWLMWPAERQQLAEVGRDIVDLKAQLAPRRISSFQANKLFRFLRNHNIPSEFVWFGHYVSVSDGASLASELADVFKRAGWNAQAVEISYNPTPGISVTGGARRHRETIIQGMDAVGLSVNSDSDYYDDPVPIMHVIIGPKPPA